MSDRFALCRGSREPMIWPFDTEGEAEEWALDHGCLDWRVEKLADRPEHAPYCDRCREAWPCKHVRLDRKASAIIAEAANTCARCGKRVSWKQVRLKGGGMLGEDVKYHGRKGACRNEGLRRLRALDTPVSRAELDRLAREEAYEREHRQFAEAEKARRRERLLALAREDGTPV